MRTYILRKAPPLKPIGEARHIEDSSCPDAGWKALTKNQKTRLAIMARKAAEVQGVSLKSKDLDEWRHEVCIKACGCRITEATQSHWADLKSAFEDLGGKPEQAFKTQLREGDNKRRVAMFKLTQALAGKGLEVGYAAKICQVQFKVPLDQASAKQLWCLFYTVTNRRKTTRHKTEMKMKTIEDEIRDLTAEARRLDWQSRRPSACPREAWSAEERYRAALEKLADLRVKAATAAKP